MQNGFAVESSTSDEEWDTDLEESANNDCESSGKLMEKSYLEACDHCGVPPVSKFLRGITIDKVDLRHYGILDRGTKAICETLKQNITVTTLNLHDNGISESGIKAIADLLEENCFITDLDISGNRIGPEGSQAMKRMLRSNSALRSLSFSNICSTGSCILPLLEGIKESFYLKVLDLSHNKMENDGAAVVGSILSLTSSLECLNLSWNNITEQGAIDIFDGLRECYTIKELNFSWNRVSDTATKALKSAIESNESLLLLDITYCSISPLGAKKIGKALKRNTTLRVLSIRDNPCLSFGAFALLKAVRRNPESALQELHFGNTALDKDSVRELNDVLRLRPNFICTWQISIQGDQADNGRPDRPLPMETFTRFTRNHGLRMVDLFKQLSSKRESLGEKVFVGGLKKMDIPMTKAELRKVFTTLDQNGDGKLQFHEFPNLVSSTLPLERAPAQKPWKKSTKDRGRRRK